MIGLRLSADKMNRGVAFFDGLKLTKSELRLMVLRCAVVATGHIRKSIKGNVERSRGKLARSFRETFLGHEGNVTSAASHSKLIYARIQEEGGTIRPKNGKTLAVPWRGANIPPGKSPRHWPAGQLHFLPRPGKPPMLVVYKAASTGYTKNTEGVRVRKEGPAKLKAIEPKYILVPKVTLKPKGYVDKAAYAANPDIERESIAFMKGVVDGSIDAANSGKKRRAK